RVVVKWLQGTQGIGVILAESAMAASSVIEAFHGLDQNILIQKFIREANGSDIRALVVGRRVVAAMRRQAVAGEFRSNIHRGGTAKKIRLSAECRKTALSAARVLGLRVAGMDLFEELEHCAPHTLRLPATPAAAVGDLGRMEAVARHGIGKRGEGTMPMDPCLGAFGREVAQDTG